MHQAAHEIVDLTRDSDHESDMLPEARQPFYQKLDSSPSPENAYAAHAAAIGCSENALNDEELAQLAALDDIDPFWPFVDETVPPLQLQDHLTEPVAQISQHEDLRSMKTPFTADTCLQQVLEIFPDVAHEYVMGLYEDFDSTSEYEALPGPARFDNIVDSLLANSDYPRQSSEKQRSKRKRQSSVEKDLEWFENTDRPRLSGFQIGISTAMLKAEFPDVSVRRIDQCMAIHRHLFQTYIAISDAIDAGDPAYFTGRRSQHPVRSLEDIARGGSHGERLLKELQAARLKVVTARSDRAEAEVKRKLEHENLKLAIERGETGECQACFDDLPLNRMIHCDGVAAHFTCFSCAETYIRTEVGADRCRVVCVSGCGQGYPFSQLQRLQDKPLLEKLARIEQQEAIRNAGLDDLEECPFCDFKMEMPPVEENFVFKCLNPECSRDSCRRCRNASHLPISCEQYAEEHKVSARHKVEEAMTAAMIRSCNKCQKKFIKDYGCNKMICTSCNNIQCYVCSKSITNYEHFTDRSHPGNKNSSAKCPLYDNAEERHDQEVKEAEAKARVEALAENPNMSAEDLEIKMSDAVNHGEATRVKQAGPLGLGMAVEADIRLHRPPVMGNLARQGRQHALDNLADQNLRPIPRPLWGALDVANAQHRGLENHHNDYYDIRNLHRPQPPAYPRPLPIPNIASPRPLRNHQHNLQWPNPEVNRNITPPLPKRTENRSNQNQHPQVDGNFDGYFNFPFNGREAFQRHQHPQMTENTRAHLPWTTNKAVGENNDGHGATAVKNRAPQDDLLFQATWDQAIFPNVPPPPVQPNALQNQAMNEPLRKMQRDLNITSEQKARGQPVDWGRAMNGGIAAYRGPRLYQPPPNHTIDEFKFTNNQTGPHRVNQYVEGHHRGGQQAQPPVGHAPVQVFKGRANVGRRD